MLIAVEGFKGNKPALCEAPRWRQPAHACWLQPDAVLLSEGSIKRGTNYFHHHHTHVAFEGFSLRKICMPEEVLAGCSHGGNNM